MCQLCISLCFSGKTFKFVKIMHPTNIYYYFAKFSIKNFVFTIFMVKPFADIPLSSSCNNAVERIISLSAEKDRKKLLQYNLYNTKIMTALPFLELYAILYKKYSCAKFIFAFYVLTWGKMLTFLQWWQQTRIIIHLFGSEPKLE